MAKPQIYTIYLLLLAITLGCANSARILDEVDPESPIPTEPFDPAETDVPDVAPVVGPTTTLPNAQISTPTEHFADVAPIPDPSSSIPLPIGPGPVTAPSNTVSPVAEVAPIVGPSIPLPTGPAPVTTPSGTVAPIANPVATSAGGTGSVASGSATVDPQEPLLTFFMHDILGGSQPSGRVVTGIIANSQDNGLPFSKTTSQVFPINGGVPLNNINGIINNNNVPFLAGLNGSPSSTVLQNNGNNNVVNGGNLPFVTAGQLPSGVTLQQLMFGSITVVDNELTEGHELGSSVLGKGQGFYLSSSLDGSSHTIALTTMFHGDDHDHVGDTISFFGVHRTATVESHIAVIGGTGKYEHAKGYATIETLHPENQHTTDGVETILHFTVYLTNP